MSSPAPSDLSEDELHAPTGQDNQKELYDQVFGGDSDVSDLSDEDDAPPIAPRRAFPPRPAAPRSESPEGPEDVVEDEEEEEEEEDVYVPGTSTVPARIPSFKKKKRIQGGDSDVDMEEGQSSQPVRKRKSKRREERVRVRRDDQGEEQEEAGPVYDEETRKRMALEERIDNIGKKAKAVRRKRKGDDDVDIVDSYHDDVCMRLRDRMMAAGDKDRESVRVKHPATAKLALLDEVMSILRNTTLWQSIIDNAVLEAVKYWLEPIDPGGALPAVGIQKAFFEVLPKMDLDTTTLKECGLGPIVLFYSRTKRVSTAINRQADALVSAWSRPLMKRAGNYTSKYVDQLPENPEPQPIIDPEDIEEGAVPVRAPVKKKRFDVRAALEENRGRKGIRPMFNREVQYSVAPQSQTIHTGEDVQHVSRIQMDNRKFNKFSRQLLQRKNK